MIDPYLFPHVEETYCNLDFDVLIALQTARTELAKINRELRGLETEVADTTKEISLRQDLYECLQGVRQSRLDCIARINQLKGMPQVRVDDAIRRQRQQDFRAICAMPSVIDARSDSEDAVIFTIHATYVYGHTRYFIGDWQVRFGDPEVFESYQMTRLFSGVRPGWSGYPDYSMGGEPVTFCVGDNAEILEELFKSQKYLQGMQLLSHVMCSINAGEESEVPLAFVSETTPVRKRVVWPIPSIAGRMPFT
jgi:uncharacterized protein YeeX (DUF496 family)